MVMMLVVMMMTAATATATSSSSYSMVMMMMMPRVALVRVVRVVELVETRRELFVVTTQLVRACGDQVLVVELKIVDVLFRAEIFNVKDR